MKAIQQFLNCNVEAKTGDKSDLKCDIKLKKKMPKL